MPVEYLLKNNASFVLEYLSGDYLGYDMQTNPSYGVSTTSYDVSTKPRHYGVSYTNPMFGNYGGGLDYTSSYDYGKATSKPYQSSSGDGGGRQGHYSDTGGSSQISASRKYRTSK